MNIELYIADRESINQALIIEQVHELILNSHPKISYNYRYKVPFYDVHSWICYLNPIKKTEGVELVFLHGQKLEDPFGILDLKGRKMVAGISIFDPNLVPYDSIVFLLDEAVQLDQVLHENKSK